MTAHTLNPVSNVHPIFCAHLITFLGLLNLDIITSTPPLVCLHYSFVCNLYLKHISFLYIQTLRNDCSHIEDIHQRRRSRAEFGLVFFLLLGLELSFFPVKMLRWCPICVICNSNSFHFFIFKLGIMIVHTLKMCTSHLCTFDKYFLIFD